MSIGNANAGRIALEQHASSRCLREPSITGIRQVTAMAGFGAILLEDESLRMLLRAVDGNLRAALICWGVVLSAFIILRVPR